STGALSNTTLFAWNDLDDPASVTDARSNATEYDYNAFGEVVEEVSPDRGTLTFEYTSAGNFSSRIDARGKETDYTYDDLRRVTDIEYPADSGNDVSLTYDNCTNGEGRL